MPKHFNNNGKNTRFWSDEEMMQRYRQGREDAGDKNSSNQYTADDLKKSYDAGVKVADTFLGVAIRSGFDEGHKQGELSGIELGKIEAGLSIPKTIVDAQRQGHHQGYLLGLAEGRSIAEYEFKATEETRKKNIAQDYLREHSWHGRAIKAYDEFISKRQEGNLTATMHFIGKIPVGRIENKTYRLHNVRTAPFDVFGLLVWNLAIKPFVIYHVLKHPYRWITEYIDKDAHGETDNQFKSRQIVQRSCSDIDKIHPNIFNKDAFSIEEKHRIESCKRTCEEAKAGYQTMMKTMQFRRKQDIGDQKHYGLRLFGSHQDKYAKAYDQSDGTCIIASPGPVSENNQLLADLSGIKLN